MNSGISPLKWQFARKSQVRFFKFPMFSGISPQLNPISPKPSAVSPVKFPTQLGN
uniref:Uncharacterized protein n=1 Tax=Rhizophora mucronata TaxID=61149 RepID=A0A2P2JD58_RHIMU